MNCKISLFSAIFSFIFLSACGTDITPHRKYDAAPDLPIIYVYLSPDVAPPPAPTCTCACSEPCDCSCDCGTGEPVVVLVPGCVPPTSTTDAATAAKNDATPVAGSDSETRRDAVVAPDSAQDTTPDLTPSPTATCPAYVDGNAVDAGIENGSPLAPWRTIQDALNNIFKNCGHIGEIIVKKGTYREQVTCSGFFGTLRSEDGPSVTIIDPSGTADKPYGIYLKDSHIIIKGFTITNASYGIVVYSVPYTTAIEHNILLRNKRGISVTYGPADNSPVIIRNNIIIGDPKATTYAYEGTGIGQHQSGGLRLVENNLIIGERGTYNAAGVFIDNWTTGFVQNNIIADSVYGILRVYDYNTMTLQYNCMSGNMHDYAGYAAAGTGDVLADPRFVNPGSSDGGTADYHLAKDSPCRNAGNPDPAYNNPDGTRNDMGPYGGPFGNW